MLHFSCLRCGYRHCAPDACAGRTADCRKCGHPVTVPGSPPVHVARIAPEPDPEPRRGRDEALQALTVAAWVIAGILAMAFLWVVSPAFRETVGPLFR